MKKQIKTICLVFLLPVLLLCVTACANWETPYTSMNEDGYCVSVRFDANGGRFAGTPDVFVVDVFNPEKAATTANGMKAFSLLRPDDTRRGDNAFEVSKNECFLAGWYTERVLRVDENGEALDDFGVLCSVSGREQGYVYSGKWDFEKDRVEIDPSKTYNSEENVLTLYAAWIPYTNFEFYSKNEQTGGFDLIGTYNKGTYVNVPEWNTKTGKLDMKQFPAIDGKTFECAYLDEAMTQPVTGQIAGEVDFEKGISATQTVKIYTTWMDGTWFKIHTAKQFYENSTLQGNYIICADLDFTNVTWSPALSKEGFKGTIQGNGYKFSNITVMQGDSKQLKGGLFGSLEASANISDVTFENITYRLEAGSLMASSFGVLAGSASNDAVLENVEISGTLVIGSKCNLNPNLGLGLLFGNDTTHAIDLSGLTYRVENAEASKYVFELDAESGAITYQIKE